MKEKIISFLFLVIICMWSFAQTVTNGSITGAPAANSGINNGNAPGWSGCGFSPDLLDVGFPSFFGGNTVTVCASPDGGTWAGIAALGECARTTITGLTPGNSYILYWCGASFGTGGIYNGNPSTPTIQVTGSASTVISIPMVACTWNAYTLNFTATSTSQELRIFHPNGSNGYASLDGFRLSNPVCGVVLPLELDYFEGEFKDCQASLKWSIPDDYQKDYFEIFRRFNDDEGFVSVGKVRSNGSRTYEWYDHFPMEQAEYQLVVHDLDGSNKGSATVNVAGHCDGAAMNVSYNSEKNPQFALLNYRPGTEQVSLNVYSVTGQLMFSTEYTMKPGEWKDIEIDVSNWADGVYVVNSSEGVSKKFILVR